MLATLEACVDATLLRPILLIESASVRAIFLPSSTDGNEVEMEVLLISREFSRSLEWLLTGEE